MPAFRVESKAFIWCIVEADDEAQAAAVGQEAINTFVSLAAKDGGCCDPIIEIGLDESPVFVETP